MTKKLTFEERVNKCKVDSASKQLLADFAESAQSYGILLSKVSSGRAVNHALRKFETKYLEVLTKMALDRNRMLSLERQLAEAKQARRKAENKLLGSCV